VAISKPYERDAAYIKTRRRYNTAVLPADLPPQPDQPSPERPAKLRIYRLEAAGILIIGAIILILTLTRYWHHIAWSAR
jgi:hypothetical protein